MKPWKGFAADAWGSKANPHVMNWGAPLDRNEPCVDASPHENFASIWDVGTNAPFVFHRWTYGNKIVDALHVIHEIVKSSG